MRNWKKEIFREGGRGWDFGNYETANLENLEKGNFDKWKWRDRGIGRKKNWATIQFRKRKEENWEKSFSIKES